MPGSGYLNINWHKELVPDFECGELEREREIACCVPVRVRERERERERRASWVPDIQARLHVVTVSAVT